MEAQVATSAADLIAAAKEVQEGRKQRVELWGRIIEIVPASASQHAKLRREVASYAAVGIPADENTVAEMAWVYSCVTNPPLTPQECKELRDAAPADFSNLSAICRSISQGTPLPLLMLGIWGGLADDLRSGVEAGRVDASILAFWTTLVRTYVWWMNSDSGKALDFRALGRDLAGLEDGAGMDEAAALLGEWAEREGVEAKNEQGAENSTSSAPVSSGQDEAPTNLPSPDGPGDSSTTSLPSTP